MYLYVQKGIKKYVLKSWKKSLSQVSLKLVEDIHFWKNTWNNTLFSSQRIKSMLFQFINTRKSQGKSQKQDTLKQ